MQRKNRLAALWTYRLTDFEQSSYLLDGLRSSGPLAWAKYHNDIWTATDRSRGKAQASAS